MIEFRDVSKSFGNHIVLDHLNLMIPTGKLTFILGLSGEGKTVLIKHIVGLIKPDTGRIIIDGDDITDYDDDQLLIYRCKIGMLFQGAALFDSMTVGENVMFPLREHTTLGLPDMLKRVKYVLSKVGLPNFEDRPIQGLLTSEKKRVGLARAVVNWPKIILYDEPTTGMDPVISEMIDALIVEIGKEEKGRTSIVVSHDLKSTLSTADNIVFLYRGKVALTGPPSVFHASKNAIVRQFFAGKVEGAIVFTEIDRGNR